MYVKTSEYDVDSRNASVVWSASSALALAADLGAFGFGGVVDMTITHAIQVSSMPNELMVRIAREFGIEFDSVIDKYVTVQDIVDYIASQKLPK